ncbi:unnamed protein product [Rhizophagus irregularis]|nr:unnamed protein product [Rhizophagus irregularis]
MAKLRADITYKRRKQESLLLKSTMANIESEQHLNLDNLDEQNNETDSGDNRNDELNHIEAEEKIDDDNDLDLDDTNVEDIDHPAQNNDAKWKLNTMFKDNLPCPF